jgi:hypothetical protein
MELKILWIFSKKIMKYVGNNMWKMERMEYVLLTLE